MAQTTKANGSVPAEANQDATSSGTDSLPEPTLLAELLSLDYSSATDKEIEGVVNKHIGKMAQNDATCTTYNVLVLYDGGRILRADANRIYTALPTDRKKPVLLILRSPGGDITAAYFIGKLCRECTDSQFEAAIPREAKSAATLICCAADRIHMGSLSELGPVDPQFDGMPALATKHSLEQLAEIVTRYPGAQAMLSDYLSKAIPVSLIGYFERAAGSAVQYAERLLSSRAGNLGLTTTKNAETARKLVYEYKDHGFAIDAREAATIFGEDVIQINSEQYRFSNRIFETLDLVEFVTGRFFNRDFTFTGSLSEGCTVHLRREHHESA